MNNDNHGFMYFDNVKMFNMNDLNSNVVGVDFTNTRTNQFVDTCSTNDNLLHDWIWIAYVACVNEDK